MQFDLNHLNAINCAVFILIKNDQFSSSKGCRALKPFIEADAHRCWPLTIRSGGGRPLRHPLRSLNDAQICRGQKDTVPKQTHSLINLDFLQSIRYPSLNYSTFLVLLMNSWLFRNDHKVAETAFFFQFKKLLKFFREAPALESGLISGNERLSQTANKKCYLWRRCLSIKGELIASMWTTCSQQLWTALCGKQNVIAWTGLDMLHFEHSIRNLFPNTRQNIA